MRIVDEALVLTALPHGEHGAVVRFLTFSHGLHAGYVPGARGRARRATLQPGNKVALNLHGRGEGQLPGATLELIASRALLAFDRNAAAILSWLSLLLAETLSDGVPHQRLAQAFDALLSGLEHGMNANAARADVVRFELLLLAEEGLGLDLERCALGGDADDLAFVSPNSGRAVSRARSAGQPWAGKLLPLPEFLRNGGAPAAPELEQAFSLTGHFLARHWFDNRPRLQSARRSFLGTT